MSWGEVKVLKDEMAARSEKISNDIRDTVSATEQVILPSLKAKFGVIPYNIPAKTASYSSHLTNRNAIGEKPILNISGFGGITGIYLRIDLDAPSGEGTGSASVKLFIDEGADYEKVYTISASAGGAVKTHTLINFVINQDLLTTEEDFSNGGTFTPYYNETTKTLNAPIGFNKSLKITYSHSNNAKWESMTGTYYSDNTSVSVSVNYVLNPAEGGDAS